MTILNPTQIETADYGVPGWSHIFNKNIDLINSILLKIDQLVDVNVGYLPDGGVLVWDASAGKWKPKVFS
jgi:hypothetical protein